VLSGTVGAVASSPGLVKAQVEAGKVRLLASWGGERTAGFPNIPTFKELGYPDVEFYGWAGVFAPRGVPEAIMTRLREAARQAVKSPETVKIFENGGTEPAYLDAPAFARFVEADSARLVAVVRKMGRVE
jgi:tripartite-type tricarboxylate transporter receptor subunit TctC